MGETAEAVPAEAAPAEAGTAWWETGTDWSGAKWITPDTGAAYAWQDFVLDVDFTIKVAAASVVFRAAGPDDFLMWQVNAATTPGKSTERGDAACARIHPR